MLAGEPKTLTELLESLIPLAKRAGAETLRFYGRAEATLKSDASPLTEADRASHELIIRELAALLPGVAIISEECDNPSGILTQEEARFWLVDPLDGTKEFLKGSGEFTVNIALIEGGRPVLGVVYAPVLELTYYAALGCGAFRQARTERAEQIQVSAGNLPPRVVASKDHAGPLVRRLLGILPEAKLKSMGSSLKFCLVAEGSADIYLRDVPTMEWDTAAAQCVVECAGGKVVDLEGNALRYGKRELKNPALLTIGGSDPEPLIAQLQG